MVTLFQWIFAHLLGDFILQSRTMVRHKQRLKARSWMLYLHCAIHGILVFLFTPGWKLIIPILVMVTHFIIDLWKLNQKEGIVYFIIDQFLHILTLFMLWCLFVAPAGWLPNNWTSILHSQSAWAIATGYLLVTFPLSFLLTSATQRWRREAEEQNIRTSVSLSEAGKWIGIFERILVFTFVITGHYEGVGFLITAKSILRFNDIKGAEARKEAEYILIGTLMSFSLSILIGLIVTRFI
ncbi:MULTISPECIES: DUF3307 domain-containing protein [Niastella]|uniref:DUF3307 domain-containing protein n=1 Tax=Niastella soli TaxID=2821487 RepID=A0ABS3Z042_9BACT|nr:DUF3307 domain-containing protein [Niastella soli]MBO9203454.1 DUF3307 domain-containing protein [Niastella soli]